MIAYLIMKPFYFEESGFIQIADVIMVLSIGFTCLTFLYSGKIPIVEKHALAYKPAIFFVLYVIIVSLCWFLIYYDFIFIKYSSYYLYNLLAMFNVYICLIRNQKSCFHALYAGVIATNAITAILLLSSGISGQRAIGYFNNPNQLGYFGLLTLILVLFIQQSQNKKRGILFNITILNSMIMIHASLSSAAIISSAVVLITYVFFNVMNSVKINYQIRLSYKQISISLVSLLLLTVALINVVMGEIDIQENMVVKSVNKKIEKTFLGQEDDDSFAGRGYDRILNHPEFLLFGAGEGLFERFNSQLAGVEIHSTYGSLLFSYGIIGALFFALFLIRVFRENFLSNLYVLLGFSLYGLTHNGIRNTLLWILFTLLIFTSSSMNNNPKEPNAIKSS